MVCLLIFRRPYHTFFYVESAVYRRGTGEAQERHSKKSLTSFSDANYFLPLYYNILKLLNKKLSYFEKKRLPACLLLSHLAFIAYALF
jgi:hypothetical protein